MLGLKSVLIPTTLEQLGAIDEEHSSLVFGVLFLATHQDASGNSCTVEEVGTKPNDSLNEVHVEHLGADLAFGTHAKECSVGQYDGESAALWSH